MLYVETKNIPNIPNIPFDLYLPIVMKAGYFFLYPEYPDPRTKPPRSKREARSADRKCAV